MGMGTEGHWVTQGCCGCGALRGVGVTGGGHLGVSGTGGAGGSGWTLYPLHPLLLLAHPETPEYPAPTAPSASPVPPAHPAVPVPSLCNLGCCFGVLTHSCAPDTWRSNVSCCAPCADVSVHPNVCCGAHLAVHPNTQPCSPTPGHAHQYPAVHPNTWAPSAWPPHMCQSCFAAQSMSWGAPGCAHPAMHPVTQLGTT